MADSELDRLRDEVIRRRRAATKKISRMRRSKGVDISGTNLDPRRSIKTIGHYNRKQLNAYLRVINNFQSRKVGFVAGVEGTPIPKSQWEHYKRLERQYNAIGDRHISRIGDIQVPTTGLTIKERDATVRPDSKRAQGEVSHRPFSRVDRNPNNVNGTDALNRLTKDLQKKLDKKFLPKELRKARKQVKDMLNTIGNNEYIKDVKDLSDYQFDILWNYTPFANNTSLAYTVIKMKATGSKDKWYSSVVEDQSSDIGEFLKWAKTLPKNAPGKKK